MTNVIHLCEAFVVDLLTDRQTQMRCPCGWASTEAPWVQAEAQWLEHARNVGIIGDDKLTDADKALLAEQT